MDGTDLVVLAKTWIQSPKDSTPIDFEEVWDLDGSTEKSNAKKRFLQVKEHLINYGLATEIDFRKILRMLEIGNGAKREVETWLMSYNVFKHYISSSQTERGYRTRAKLHQAEEELQAIKADPMLLLGVQSKPLTPIQLHLLQAQVMADNEARTQAEFSSVRSEIAEIKHEMYANTGYVSMKGYCHMRDISAPLQAVNRMGTNATKLAVEAGIVIGKVPDERWGSVNSYPISFLDENWDAIEGLIRSRSNRS